MPTRIPTSTRAVGVLGGVAGALLTGAVGFALMNWLSRPLSDAEALMVVLSFGTVVVFSWAGILLSLILFGISVHAVVDALGKAKGNSARRLAIVSVLLLALLLAAAISDGEANAIGVALLVLGPIAGLNIAAPVLYGRASRDSSDKA